MDGGPFPTSYDVAEASKDTYLKTIVTEQETGAPLREMSLDELETGLHFGKGPASPGTSTPGLVPLLLVCALSECTVASMRVPTRFLSPASFPLIVQVLKLGPTEISTSNVDTASSTAGR